MDEQDIKIDEQLGKKYTAYAKRAGILQNKVCISEINRLQKGEINYSSKHARMAAVHSREDIILIISYLLELIPLLQYIFWLLVFITGLIGYIAFVK